MIIGLPRVRHRNQLGPRLVLRYGKDMVRRIVGIRQSTYIAKQSLRLNMGLTIEMSQQVKHQSLYQA